MGITSLLKHRIIPTLLYDSTLQCVKPVAFERPYRKLGTLMQYIQVVERRNVDELVLLDISATEESRRPLFRQITEFTNEIYCPVTVGGGIHKLDDILFLLGCGADKVAINARLADFPFIRAASEKFGSQAIVAAVNVKNGRLVLNNVVSAYPIPMICQTLESYGVGEILLTDVEKDGTMDGYDLDLIAAVSSAVSIPVIASGGCSGPLDMVEAVRAGASAVAAGSLFLYTETTPRDCAKFLNDAMIPVRI